MQLNKKYYILIISIALLAANVAGCATRAAYFKLDPSLQKDMRSFGGVEYIPLAGLCAAYGIDYKLDPYIKTASIRKNADETVLRAGSDIILFNGKTKKLGRPVVFYNGAIFVPLSFVETGLKGMITQAAVEKAPRPEERLQGEFTINTIVIDPGHGGKDAGATGRRLKIKEKEKALYLAKRLKGILEASGIRVIMTRSDDRFITLLNRANTANSCNADLFVSVHLNASRTRSMRGFECYFLSNATDDNARALEAFEDSSLKLNDSANLEHSKELDKTLWDMTLTENRLESAQLASYICESIDKSVTISNRGIRSARFYVLKHTRMPSVLVEAGYISNKYEELKLKDNIFLDKIANAVAEGILRYKREYERTRGFTNI